MSCDPFEGGYEFGLGTKGIGLVGQDIGRNEFEGLVNGAREGHGPFIVPSMRRDVFEKINQESTSEIS
jgi:hypothetical protein